MPLFEYHCSECGAAFEKLVSTSRRDEVTCDTCGSERVERQVSTFAAKSASSGGGTGYTPAPRFT
jgi:putative FmdB family regulatory protein